MSYLLPKVIKLALGKRRVHRVNTLYQLNRLFRVSIDRLSHVVDSQSVASLEGESGPTPAGKTLSHTYPEVGSGGREGTSVAIDVSPL